MTSQQEDPLVSIVIASYNRAQLLEIAVRSGLDQEWANIEVVVSDDASKDESIETLKRIGDPRLRFTAHPGHVGVWTNWTTALQMARGEYVVFLGDDDWIDPTFVRKHIECFERHPGIEAVFSSVEDRPVDGSPSNFMVVPFSSASPVPAIRLVDGLMDGQLFFGGALFRRESAWRHWSETKPDDMVADWGMILSLALQPGGRVGACNEVLYIKRLHAQRLSARFLEVTTLMASVCARMAGVAADPRARGRLAQRAILEKITLSRHYAALGDLASCRSVLWSCLGKRYAQGIVVSQLAQSYLMPGHLIRTARLQR
jgi:glycosyltransferase involved in cell wall biosynthesis